MLKQRLIAAISAAMLFAGSIPVITYADYSDVPEDAWYAEYLTGLTEKNAINGYEDGTFKPDKTVTVAEFVKTLVSLTLGEPTATVDGHWAQKYINEAIGKGIAASNLDGYDEPISRGLMAQLLDNATVYALEEEILSDTSAASQLKDWDALGDVQKSVAQCYCKGLIGGYEDGEFKADNKMTRAEMCAVLIRLVDESQRLKNVTATPEPTPEATAEPAMVNIKYINKEDDSELSEEEHRVIEEKGVLEENPLDLRTQGYRLRSYVIDDGEEVILDELPLKLDAAGDKDINLTYYYEPFAEEIMNPAYIMNGRGINWINKVYHYTEDRGMLERCYHNVEYTARLEADPFDVRSINGTMSVKSGEGFGLDNCNITMIVGCEIEKGSIGECMPGELDPDIDMPVYIIKPPTVLVKLPFETKGDESGAYADKSQGSSIELTLLNAEEFAMINRGTTKVYEYELVIPEEQRIVDKDSKFANMIITPSGMKESENKVEIVCTGNAVGDALWDRSYYTRLFIVE